MEATLSLSTLSMIGHSTDFIITLIILFSLITVYSEKIHPVFSSLESSVSSLIEIRIPVLPPPSWKTREGVLGQTQERKIIVLKGVELGKAQTERSLPGD